MAGKLRDYEAKRDLAKTPEPAGKAKRRARPNASAPRFVVQEHSATRLHWDLRLERDGALVSFAVPNALPAEPGRNHLAVHTEDHPLEYLDFHGEIPKGNYGAGTMTIWDRGTYDVLKWEPRKIEVHLHGERVDARYALFGLDKGEDAKDWMIHRMDPPDGGVLEPMPEQIVPMLARAGRLPTGRDDARYGYEIKWDGVRAIAHTEPGRLRLTSRNGNDITRRYPELARVNRALSHHRAILDGEVVVFDAEGRPSFAALQRRMHLGDERRARRLANEAPVTYVIFDLLWLDGHSLLEQPYCERRELLRALVRIDPAHPRWQVPEHVVGHGAGVLAAAREQGLEGVVAKRLDCPYEPGRRAAGWIKVKVVQRQELVIGGWAPGEGRRRERIGALLLGVHDADGKLRYAGRVGTGFDDAELTRLAGLLGPLERTRSPFAPASGLAKPPRGAIWVEPELVCEVEFTEWTGDGQLRHPSYKGLRDDKGAGDVVREGAEPTAEAGDDDGGAGGEDGGAGGDDGRAGAGRGAGAGSTLAVRPDRSRKGGALGEIEGRELKLSNLDKVLYPAVGFTKRDVIDYHLAVAPVLLGHLRDRPLTLKRYPNGVEAAHFYEKNAPSHRPDWVRTERAGSIDYVVADDVPTLVWLANLADLELHTSLSRAHDMAHPTTLAFDLDPGPPATIVECCRVALWLQGMFEGLGLECWPKTSGSKGMQVYVPLNAGKATYAQTKAFAKAVAELLEQTEPGLVVSRQAKMIRKGKVLVDWGQNDEHKTTINVYSLRARERPTVSTPLTWEEVADAHAAGDPERLVFTAADLPARVERHGDLFAPVLSTAQELPAL